MYNNIVLNAPKNIWICFLDIDEFITLINFSLETFSIKAFNSGCSITKLNWLNYGNNGKKYKDNKSVLESYPHPAQDFMFISGLIDNGEAKLFIKGGTSGYLYDVHSFFYSKNNCCDSDFVHLSEKRCGNLFVIPPKYNNAYIRHYVTKSEEEWSLKIKRWNVIKGCWGRHTWKFYNLVNEKPPNVPNTNINDSEIIRGCIVLGKV